MTVGIRNQDNRQILEHEKACRAGGEGHSPSDPTALLAEDKFRIVLDGLRGEDSIAELCPKEGIAQSLYCTWSKEFMEAGKRRLAGDTARAATSDEVKDLRRETSALKECVADLKTVCSKKA
jgi:transposase-like protein